ncbi:Ryncolin-1 [Stylophora pistillata]|uniref:Ryncolin-1 n=1 Tax=Stylophora pistillata TaxID=50429 RepID=A0A2B4SNS9_STYPI|nr:Ryncolin-1 [Stylophora pistillata]
MFIETREKNHFATTARNTNLHFLKQIPKTHLEQQTKGKSACEDDSFQCGEKGICIPNYKDGSVRCKCDDGYGGKPCDAISCSQLFQDGHNSSGVFTINPDGGKAIQVLCDMKTDGGGWTVLQRRLDGSVDFYLGWESYKKGFGNLNSEFWLGNDYIHRLTVTDDVMLRVDLEDFDGNVTYAEYTTFKVADEADKYRLLIGGYGGTAGDSMIQHK